MDNVKKYAVILTGISLSAGQARASVQKLEKAVFLLDNEANIKMAELKKKLGASDMSLIPFMEAAEKIYDEYVSLPLIQERDRQAGERFCEIMKTYHEQLENQRPKRKPNHRRFIYDWRKDKRRR